MMFSMVPYKWKAQWRLSSLSVIYLIERIIAYSGSLLPVFLSVGRMMEEMVGMPGSLSFFISVPLLIKGIGQTTTAPTPLKKKSSDL